jgi:hypothetical protein
VEPQEPKDVTRVIARDLSSVVGELVALKGDATHWLEGPEYDIDNGWCEAYTGS